MVYEVFLILTIPMSTALENEVEDWSSLEEIYAEGFKEGDGGLLWSLVYDSSKKGILVCSRVSSEEQS